MQRSTTSAAAVNRQTVQKYILAGRQFRWTVQNETVIRPEEFSSPFSPRPSRLNAYAWCELILATGIRHHTGRGKVIAIATNCQIGL